MSVGNIYLAVYVSCPQFSYLLLRKWKAVTQSYLTLCNPMNCSPPSSSVHGISQARILEWGCHFLLQGTSQPRDQTQVSCIAGRFFDF